MGVLMIPGSYCITKVGQAHDYLQKKTPNTLKFLNCTAFVTLGALFPLSITISVIATSILVPPFVLVPILSIPLTGIHFFLVRKPIDKFKSEFWKDGYQFDVKNLEKIKRSLTLHMMMSSIMVPVSSLWNPIAGIIYAHEVNEYFNLHKECNFWIKQTNRLNESTSPHSYFSDEEVYFEDEVLVDEANEMDKEDYPDYLQGFVKSAVHQIINTQETEEKKREAIENIENMISLSVVAQMVVIEELKQEKILCPILDRKKALKTAHLEYQTLSKEIQQKLVEGIAKNAIEDKEDTTAGRPDEVSKKLWNAVARLADPLYQGNDLIHIGNFYKDTIPKAVDEYRNTMTSSQS